MEIEEKELVNQQPNWQIPAIFFTIISVIFASQIVYRTVPAEIMETPIIPSILVNFAMLHGVSLLTICLTVFLLVPRDLRRKALKIDQPPTSSMIVKALITTAIIIPIVELIFGITIYFMMKYGFELTENPIVSWMKTAPSNVICLLIFGAVVVAPVAEEVMFRLVIYDSILKISNSTIACYFTSLIFARFHMIPEQTLPLFILAVVLQKSLEKSNCLWTPILIHSFFNSFAVILTIVGRCLA